MITYIALFRGINVGGKNILPMKGLVQILEDLSCKNVKTYIQSGNVVFRIKHGKPDQLAEEISRRIFEIHGFQPKVFLLGKPELLSIIKNNPFDSSDGKALHFIFLSSIPAKPDLEKLNDIKTNTEKFELIKNVFYLYTHEGIGRSKLAANVEKYLGISGTARNLNTINKLTSML